MPLQDLVEHDAVEEAAETQAEQDRGGHQPSWVRSAANVEHSWQLLWGLRGNMHPWSLQSSHNSSRTTVHAHYDRPSATPSGSPASPRATTAGPTDLRE